MGGRSKKQSKQFLANFFHASSWKLALVLILLLFITATVLRFDNIRMNRYLNTVLELDAAEASDEEIASALNDLNHFVLHHIIINRVSENGAERIIFGTGPFYLENQYLRHAKAALAEAQKQAESSATNPNGNIYQKVASVCDALGKKHGWRYPDPNYLNCWQEEIAKYPAADNLVNGPAALPSTELFRHEYLSPYWYPCFSGIILLFCAIITLILILRLIIWLVVQIAVVFIDRRH